MSKQNARTIVQTIGLARAKLRIAIPNPTKPHRAFNRLIASARSVSYSLRRTMILSIRPSGSTADKDLMRVDQEILGKVCFSVLQTL
jgi:hypothetical protein